MDFEDFQLQQSLQNFANTSNTMETEATNTQNGQVGEQIPDPQMDLLTDDMAVLGKKKRKKPGKKLSNLVPTDDKENKVCTEKTSGEEETMMTYEQLLTRLMARVKEWRKDEPKKKLSVPPLLVSRGGRRVALLNFMDVCKRLKRPPQHLLLFTSVELGTTCTVNSANHLLVRGKYNQNQFEKLILEYCEKFVICPECRSVETILIRDGRFTYLSCDNCLSRPVVEKIKHGYQAKLRN